MVDLIAKSPCDGLLPKYAGTVALSEVAMMPLTALAPYPGKASALSGALKSAHGVDLPGPNATQTNGDVTVIWFGHAHVLLMGVSPDAGLAAHAAVTDQSDAWTIVRLEGAGSRDVLARLTTLDLRDSAFAVGQTARAELMHMQSSISRIGDDAWQIMVFRSMAKTLVHDLTEAMASVANRV